MTVRNNRATIGNPHPNLTMLCYAEPSPLRNHTPKKEMNVQTLCMPTVPTHHHDLRRQKAQMARHDNRSAVIKAAEKKRLARAKLVFANKDEVNTHDVCAALGWDFTEGRHRACKFMLKLVETGIAVLHKASNNNEPNVWRKKWD